MDVSDFVDFGRQLNISHDVVDPEATPLFFFPLQLLLPIYLFILVIKLIQVGESLIGRQTQDGADFALAETLLVFVLDRLLFLLFLGLRGFGFDRDTRGVVAQICGLQGDGVFGIQIGLRYLVIPHVLVYLDQFTRNVIHLILVILLPTLIVFLIVLSYIIFVHVLQKLDGGILRFFGLL